MDLEKLLSQHQIKLSRQIFSLCHEGIEIMRKSIDPAHDETHIERNFSNLDSFLMGEKKIDKSKIDFETLLLSICWHDVWKSTRTPTNIISLFFYQFKDGLESMKMFAKRAKEVGLPERLIRNVSYSIRKHGDFQFLPLTTQEAQILKDIDTLDSWSLEKLRGLEKIYLVPGKINFKILRLAKFYFESFQSRKTAKVIQFDWNKAEFEKRKKLYLKEVNSLLEKYKNKLS